MAENGKNYHGTVTSHLKPVVTMLTEALIKDFAPAYRLAGKPFPPDTWIRTDEDGNDTVVDDRQLLKDVETWLLDLEEQMETESDRAYAKIVTHMIRKNKGWVGLLTNRVKKRLESS
jgi:hypothetical protein